MSGNVVAVGIPTDAEVDLIDEMVPPPREGIEDSLVEDALGNRVYRAGARGVVATDSHEEIEGGDGADICSNVVDIKLQQNSARPLEGNPSVGIGAGWRLAPRWPVVLGLEGLNLGLVEKLLKYLSIRNASLEDGPYVLQRRQVHVRLRLFESNDVYFLAEVFRDDFLKPLDESMHR